MALYNPQYPPQPPTYDTNPRLPPGGSPPFYPGPSPEQGPYLGGPAGGGMAVPRPAIPAPRPEMGGPPPASAWDPVNAWLRTQDPQMVAQWRQQMQGMPQGTGDRYRYLQGQMARYGGGAQDVNPGYGGADTNPRLPPAAPPAPSTVGDFMPSTTSPTTSAPPGPMQQRPPVPQRPPKTYTGKWRSPQARQARRAGTTPMGGAGDYRGGPTAVLPNERQQIQRPPIPRGKYTPY